MVQKITISIDDATEQAREAYERYQEACQKAGDAEREKAACFDALNEAQKKFDEAIEAFKSHNAGRDTKWWPDGHKAHETVNHYD